jgi:hypothetical protein
MASVLTGEMPMSCEICEKHPAAHTVCICWNCYSAAVDVFCDQRPAKGKVDLEELARAIDYWNARNAEIDQRYTEDPF